MESGRVLTDTQMKAAEMKVGDILAPNSPQSSDDIISDDGENTSELHVSYPESSAYKYYNAVDRQPSANSRKRTYADVVEREDSSSFLIGDLRSNFDAVDDSLISLVAVEIDSDSHEVIDQCDGTLTESRTMLTEEDPDILAEPAETAMPDNSPLVETEVEKIKPLASVAVPLKALTAFMAMHKPIDIMDFSPFKLPIKLEKRYVVDYQLRIRKRCCLGDAVKTAANRDMMDPVQLSSNLVLAPLNALAFNSYDADVSGEARKLLHLSVVGGEMIQSSFNGMAHLDQDEVVGLIAALKDQCATRQKKSRSRPRK